MPSAFIAALRAHQPTTPPLSTRPRWAYIPYDQLSDKLGALAQTAPAELGIILIESAWRPAQRPYHKQKLALILANQRRFAIEQAARGVAVRYITTDASYHDALAPLAREQAALGRPIEVMRPAERELRALLAPLITAGLLVEAPHDGWLTTPADFIESQGDKTPWRMDAFYRYLRKRTGILMERGKPLGGKYSHDAENRLRWDGEPPAPEPPRFEPDAITREVGQLVASRFAHHPGALDLGALPTSAADAERLWRFALAECLPRFGPYEDAMSTRSRTLFHSCASPLINLHRITPARALADVLALDIELASKEGFVRQLIGWREFMRHVHEQTDGFRVMPEGHAQPPVAQTIGHANWSGWRDVAGDGGAAPPAGEADISVPPAFWGAESGMLCLDHVVSNVMATGFSHHIERLMVLSNIATLLEISPRALTDWFWCAYIDAYDWVVEPNVLGMGTFALGELFTTKPYISGSNYIDKMSDYCKKCSLKSTGECPVTRLYWAYLGRHEEALAGNQRVAMPLRTLARRDEAERALDAATFERVRAALGAGQSIVQREIQTIVEERGEVNGDLFKA